MAKPTKKQQRAAEQIHEILSTLLQFEVSDPRLRGITVMEVEVDRELMYADVYVNAIGAEDEQEEILAALEQANGFLRYNLAQEARMRQIPELRFKWDETLAQAQRINELLDSLDIPTTDEEDSQEDDTNS